MFKSFTLVSRIFCVRSTLIKATIYKQSYESKYDPNIPIYVQHKMHLRFKKTLKTMQITNGLKLEDRVDGNIYNRVGDSQKVSLPTIL